MNNATPKILVVDDNQATRTVYRDWIAAIGGVDVIEASGGQQAVEIARAHDFAMILLDMGMPDLDGFETAAVLRQDLRLDTTPIVFITTELSRHQRVQGYRMGAVDCLVSEPLDPEIVTQKARVFLQLYRKRQELQVALENTGRLNQELHTRLEQHVQALDQKTRLTMHEPLTGLPNVALFNDRVAFAIKRAQRSRLLFALASARLGGLKKVVDEYGQAAGDALIKTVSSRMSQALRASDTVARVGEDKFALLFEEIESAAVAGSLAEKIHTVVAQPVTLNSEIRNGIIGLCVSVSIGVVVYPDHAYTHADLTAFADLAMADVQRAGGGVRVHNGSGRSVPGVENSAPAPASPSPPL